MIKPGDMCRIPRGGAIFDLLFLLHGSSNHIVIGPSEALAIAQAPQMFPSALPMWIVVSNGRVGVVFEFAIDEIKCQ